VISPCTTAYEAFAEIADPILNGQIECPKDMADVFAVASCEVGKKITNQARTKVDEKILCMLFCCCLKTGGNQACVEEALKSADKKKGYKARYKAEVTYNMQFNPPRPMMEKDTNGELTTKPIPRGNYYHLNNRAEKEFDPKLRREPGKSKYRYRRPDVVIVEDPTLPPTKDNISQVIEMKFPKDSFRRNQKKEYKDIGGHSKFKIYKKDTPCKCDNKRRQRAHEPVSVPDAFPFPASIPEAKRRPIDVHTGPSGTDWAILIALGIVTIGFALSPFDGPAGEISTASAAAAQWARMFSTPAL